MRERNYGIDLLRIVAMFFVVIQHILINGGVIDGCQTFLQRSVCWTIEIIAYCSVNCYAIISGYVGYGKERRSSKIIELWLQVVFYGIVAFVLFQIFCSTQISTTQLIKSCFPIIFNQYWFFSAYVGLFAIMPLINKLGMALSHFELTHTVIIIFLLFSFLATIGAPIGDGFNLNGGYSFLWLVFCYMTGVWMKKICICEKISPKMAAIAILLIYFLVWFLKIPGSEMSRKFIGESVGENLLIAYNSPAYFCIAILYVIIFARLNLRKYLKKLIKFLSPAVFGVYLIHMQPLVKEKFIIQKFCVLGTLNACYIPFMVLLCACGIFISCSMIDKFRAGLFCAMRVNKLSNYVEKTIQYTLKIIVDKVCGLKIKDK